MTTLKMAKEELCVEEAEQYNSSIKEKSFSALSHFSQHDTLSFLGKKWTQGFPL